MAYGKLYAFGRTNIANDAESFAVWRPIGHNHVVRNLTRGTAGQRNLRQGSAMGKHESRIEGLQDRQFPGRRDREQLAVVNANIARTGNLQVGGKYIEGVAGPGST